MAVQWCHTVLEGLNVLHEFQYTGTVTKILIKGGMTIKFMAVTGSNDKVNKEQLGGKTLGVCYKINTDKIHCDGGLEC